MRLLPSEQKKAIELAIKKYDEKGELAIYEPCDCGSHIRHNNGGNYHKEIFLKRDGDKHYVKYESTSELDPPAEWEETNTPHKIIEKNADWL